jgi:hypothetical protein
MIQTLLVTCFHASIIFGLFFSPEDGGVVPPEVRCNFKVLNGFIIPEGNALPKYCFDSGNPLLCTVGYDYAEQNWGTQVE